MFLRFMSLSWGCIGAQFSLTGVLRASGNMVVAMVLTLVVAVGVAVPARLRVVGAHAARAARDLVGDSDRERRDAARDDGGRRERRLEGEAADEA